MSKHLVQIQSARSQTPEHQGSRERADRAATSAVPGLYIKTFGCQMNEYDSMKLEKILEGSYRLVDSPEKAKLILVNTCSVREKPEHKLYSLLGQLDQYKKENEDVLIGVGGCVAQQEGEKITKRSKVVDFVFGTHNLSLVPSLIERRKDGYGQQVAVDYRDEWEDLPAGFAESRALAETGFAAGRTSTFVSISRGCNKNCTYCIVPTTRGKEVSRPLDEILREVKIAAHRGSKEIVLLGQTVNSYGRDLSPRIKFVDLLQHVSDIEGVERIRFTSPHPQEVRNDFYELVANNPKVCRHIHMPLQSGSDAILKAMNRNYRRQKYLDIIAGLKDRVPDIAITTDIIVGFPGETRKDFEDTLEIMRTVQFDSSYSFVFSSRPGTKAAEMEDAQPYQEKLEWLQELQALQEEITNARLATYPGTIQEVLVDGFSKVNKKLLQGRNSQNIMVNLERELADIGPGDTIPVKINAVSRYTLKGTYEPGILQTQ